jgi:glycosyltransferase involved in cell wall biosynthesis
VRELALAWCSPLPPTRSGVADYAFELLPELSGMALLTVVRPPGWEGPQPSWAAAVRWSEAEAAPSGVNLCHLGNNPHHIWIAQRLRRFGGVVVLHDAVLHHLLVEEAAAEGAWDRFAQELEAAHGSAGEALARARRWGFSGPLDPFLFPARRALLRFAQGVVVHNRWQARTLQEELPSLPVARVPLAVAALAASDGGGLRRELGVGPQELLAVHLGFLTPAKGLDTILRAFAVLEELKAPVRLWVVGEGVEAAALERAVEGLGLSQRVRLLGYASPQRLGEVLAAADVGLVPRFPTAGETSAAALRFFAAGKPVVVCGLQQFLEFPPEVALRIRPGREGAVELVRWLGFLAENRQALEEKKRLAKQFWQREGHEPRAAARALVEAVAALVQQARAAGKPWPGAAPGEARG